MVDLVGVMCDLWEGHDTARRPSTPLRLRPGFAWKTRLQQRSFKLHQRATGHKWSGVQRARLKLPAGEISRIG